MIFRALRAGEINAIAAYDIEHFRLSPYNTNRNRFYKYLTVTQGGDVQVRTVAVITRKYGKRAGISEVKEVVRASADRSGIWVKDLELCGMGGYQVDWSPEKCGRARWWSYGGEWQHRDSYSRRSRIYKICCDVINPGAVRQSARFQWCAYNRDCGDVLDYLKLYKDRPRIEMLAKAGVGWFASRIGFVRRLERNKRLLSFFSKSLSEIRDARCGVDAIDKALREGMTVTEAAARINAARVFKCYVDKLHGVDAYKAQRYIAGHKGMDAWDYAEYINWCFELGMDLSDTKVAFPNGGHRRIRQVKEMRDAARRKIDARARRALAKDLRARASRFGAVCEKVDGGLVAHVPSREKEFIEEGKKLHHCVGRMGYAAKMARGDSLIVFVRDAAAPDRPFVTAEIDPETGKVLQCYGKDNSRPSDAVLEFVERKVAKAVARIAKREKAKRKGAEAQRVA